MVITSGLGASKGTLPGPKGTEGKEREKGGNRAPLEAEAGAVGRIARYASISHHWDASSRSLGFIDSAIDRVAV